MDYTIFVVLAVAAYLAGAIPFSLLFARLFGLADPRTFGSGNPGATNIARAGSKSAALLTLLADIGKGFLSVLLVAMWMNANAWQNDIPSLAVACVGAAAVCGHVFSVFLRFRGGKGVATALGVFAAWNATAAAVAAASWLAVFALFRVSSASSITAMVVGAVTLAIFAPLPIAIAGGTCALLVIFRHRQNIMDLFAGSERGFAEQTTKSNFSDTTAPKQGDEQ